MENTQENPLNSLFWPIIFIISVSAVLEIPFIYFILSIGFFSASFYLFLIEGIVLYTVSYLLVFRKLITGTGKPETPGIILIIFCLFTLTFFMLGFTIIAALVLGGRRDKKTYYMHNPKPAKYTEFFQVITDGASKGLRRFRVRRNVVLVISLIVMSFYAVEILNILGFLPTSVQEFFHHLAPGLNPNLLALFLSFIGIPIAFIPFFNPVSGVYKYLPGRTGVITRLKGNNGFCIVKVEGIKFKAKYPLGLGVGTEVLVKKVLTRGSTKSAILDIEPYYQDSRSNLAWSTT